MTYKTMKRIHELLEEEAWQARRIYEEARDLLEEMKDSDPRNRTLIEEQEELVDRLEALKIDAMLTLEEFENQDWR